MGGSHLLQMRGLKPATSFSTPGDCRSHLLQMRGLKQPGLPESATKVCRIFYRCVD